MLTGGTALSYRKQDLTNQKYPAVGFSKLAFSHKANLGDLGISLLSLTLPPELAVNGLSNPSGSELLNTNLLLYKNNITIVSSVRGALQHGVSYLIPSSSQINFLNFTASDGEVFTGTVDYVASSGVRVVDGQAVTASGVLGGDSRDFSVGTPFTVGKYLNAQVGAVLVFLDGVLQKRNTGNSATVLDGSYYELDLGNGLASVIRFNSASGTSRNVLVVSNGLLCDRPDGSLVASIEKLQGQINNMASYVATLAATSSAAVLGTTPTYIDLKTFGDRVISLESSDMTIKGNKTFSRPIVVQDGSSNTILSYSSTSNGFTLGKSSAAGAQSLNYLENGNSGVGQTGLVIRGRDGSSLSAPDTSYLSLEDKVSGHANIIGMASYAAGTTNRYALEFRHVSDTGTSTVLGLSTKEGSWNFGTGSSNSHVFNGALSATTTLSIGSVNATPVSQLTNSSIVLSDSGSLGVNSAAGLTWSANGTGWAAGVSNSSSSANSSGLLVKTSATDSATSILKAESGGATRVVFKSDGKVGINTSTPAAGLDIATTLNLSGYGTIKSALVQKYPSATSKAQQFLTKNKTGQFKRSQAEPTVSTWTARASAADNSWSSVCWSAELGIFVAVAASGVGNRVMTSPDGITWTARTPATDNSWNSVCWSPELGIFVAVASSGSGSQSTSIMSSPDGITWTTRTPSISNGSWTSICWSPELGLFVVTGNGSAGNVNNKLMTSPDGITWTSRTASVGNFWNSVCWSAELGLFVAVAVNGSGDRVMTSSDGITWTTRASAADYNWFSVCWSAELSLFVAITQGYSVVMTSSDGINWTSRNISAPANNWNSVCWSPELGLFVSVANSGTGNRVMTSPDGTTWTARTSAADNYWISVCWSPELQTFAAVGGSGTGNRVMTASYPITVSSTGSVNVTGAINAASSINATGAINASSTVQAAGLITASSGILVKNTAFQKYSYSNSKTQQFLTKNKTGQFKRSQAVATVSTWITKASSADNSWNSVCWSPELGLFVAVAQSGTGNRVMTSPDGTTWTSRTSAADNQWSSVCWSPELGLFVAVSVSGTGNRVMTSPNGITWTIRTSASDNNWNSVCWSAELGLFVAVATGATVSSGRVMTSTDGITWTARTAAYENYWSSVCWSAELGIFVAVSSAAATKETSVMTSSDGINWTARTSPLLSTWNSVCWSAELSLFVAVSSFGTGNRVMTSPDGITWTSRTSATDNDWYSVCWSAELGIFIATATTGTGNRVMTSPDGLTWTSRTSAADNSWYSVCWSPELQIFATVGASGTGNRVMTASYPLTVTATGDTTAIGNIKATGNIIAAATLTASDERLKANIKTINDAVNKVMALRGVSFERNGKEQIGVIAQEVQKVLPQVVDVPDDANDFLAVSYGNIVGLLIEAVKDQQNQIEDLKKLVEARS